MREIKFRAWHSSEQMIVWDSLQENSIHFVFGYGTLKLMQYTGLKDKNGKEIYEGDITQYGWAIAWHRGCFGRWYGGKFASMDELDMSRIEIVGNVCENPELLTA